MEQIDPATKPAESNPPTSEPAPSAAPASEPATATSEPVAAANEPTNQPPQPAEPTTEPAPEPAAATESPADTGPAATATEPVATAEPATAEPPSQLAPAPASPKPDRLSARLRRRREGRMIAGVCTGLAAAWGIDPVLARLLFVAIGVIFFPLGPLAYVVFWMLMPEED